ncbi:MAG: DsbA family oxidoreductase [Gaiellales bacterium]
MESSSTASESDIDVQLEVWSDVACPWCYVGRRNLSIALADMEPHERPTVTWRAYQLDPTIPEEGVESESYYAHRFGADISKLEEGRERLVVTGEEIGIDFRFDRQRTAANTHLVHRVLAAADRHGEREPLLDAVFAANFERGIDIGDAQALHEVIVAQLGDEQLADEIIDAAQNDEALVAAVDGDIALARELGITGVPCFVADRAIAVPGAVPPPVLAQLMAEARARTVALVTDDSDD